MYVCDVTLQGDYKQKVSYCKTKLAFMASPHKVRSRSNGILKTVF